MEAPKLNDGTTKAGDWRNYERVLLPPVRDLHKLDVYEQQGGYSALRAVLSDGKFDPKGLASHVRESGLRGRGGAAFNTGLKWSFMPPVDPDVPRFLCCNGDESEPGTFKDRQLFEYNPHLVIEGMVLANYAISATACYIYIRGEYAHWIRHFQRAVDEAYAKGYIGQNILGSGFSTDIVVHKGAGAYICGEETSLMESLEGKRGYPRVKPPFPAQKGIWARPTTINNVETLAHVPLIVNRGAEWFAGVGAEKHPGPTIYGISGHVNKPGAYEYPTGMLISDLIDEVCGGMRNGKKFKALVPGGSSTPVLTAEHVRRHDDGRREPPRSGLDDGHGRDARDGRGHRHGELPPPHHPLLPPRVLRAVHAVSRRHRLARKARHPDRRGRGQPPRPRPAARTLRQHGGPHHLRARRRRRVARPLDDPPLPLRVRGEVPAGHLRRRRPRRRRRGPRRRACACYLNRRLLFLYGHVRRAPTNASRL